MREGRRERLSQLLPNEEDLVSGLTAAMRVDTSRAKISIIDRQLNTYSSSHPSEVVRCVVNGTERAVLIKYGKVRERHPHIGRRGVEYEANVYRHVLHPHGVSAPPLLGILEHRETEATWLMIEFLTRCDRLDDLDDAVLTAATWLGRFHAFGEQTWSPDALSFVKVFDAEYNRYWIEGAARRLAPLATEHPWVDDVVGKVEEFVNGFTAEPAVFIHGEFYPHNILVRNGEIYPVDWESAAFGCPEIDLVSLIDGWDEHTASACKDAYKLARWGKPDNDGFDRSFLFAEVYWNLRWLSGLARNRPPFDPSAMSSLPPRLLRLQENCERMHAAENPNK